MPSRVKKFLQHNQDDIILFMVVFLICLLCFAAGYLVAKQQQKEPLRFGVPLPKLPLFLASPFLTLVPLSLFQIAEVARR